MSYPVTMFVVIQFVVIALLWWYIIKLERMVRRLDIKMSEHLRFCHTKDYEFHPTRAPDKGDEPMWIDRHILPRHKRG